MTFVQYFGDDGFTRWRISDETEELGIWFFPEGKYDIPNIMKLYNMSYEERTEELEKEVKKHINIMSECGFGNDVDDIVDELDDYIMYIGRKEEAKEEEE